MLTHHASNGCNLRSGDLLASGTVSGADKTARGCLLELTSRGKDPVTLPTGEQRKFLEDGDEVILRGFCERDGFRRIGLGSCRGRILPATEKPVVTSQNAVETWLAASPPSPEQGGQAAVSQKNWQRLPAGIRYIVVAAVKEEI